jgi:hypothetical protein
MKIADNGGRRLATERRQLSDQINFPDRRSGRERRGRVDRRIVLDRRSQKGFRAIVGSDRRRMLISCFKTSRSARSAKFVKLGLTPSNSYEF